MKTTFVTACTHLEFIDLMLDYMPEEPWDCVKELVIIAGKSPEGDVAFQQEVQSFVRKKRPRWPIRVVSAQMMRATWMPEALWTYVERSLGFKVLLPFFIDPPFVWFDDDVVIINDPGELFDANYWHSHSGLDWSIPGNRRDLEEMRQFGLDQHKFNIERTDAGVIYVPALSRVEYQKFLEWFFTLPTVVETAASPKGNRFRILDQRCWSVWLMNKASQRRIASTGYHLWCRRPPYIPKKVPWDYGFFCHYAASGVKWMYVNFLREQLKLKREAA